MCALAARGSPASHRCPSALAARGSPVRRTDNISVHRYGPIVDYASLPHFCKREGSGSSRHSTSGSDDCFSLDHPFHQQLYNYIKQQQGQEYVALLKQGSFHVDVPEPDLEGIKIVKTIESALHKIGDLNGLNHSPSDPKIDGE
ncbi:hypothetical protein BHM03_00060391 [Ensete ventricosum]|nr:hypothetical protein BHM03_00060391 [Ensete ventricosum]